MVGLLNAHLRRLVNLFDIFDLQCPFMNNFCCGELGTLFLLDPTLKSQFCLCESGAKRRGVLMYFPNF